MGQAEIEQLVSAINLNTRATVLAAQLTQISKGGDRWSQAENIRLQAQLLDILKTLP